MNYNKVERKRCLVGFGEKKSEKKKIRKKKKIEKKKNSKKKKKIEKKKFEKKKWIIFFDFFFFQKNFFAKIVFSECFLDRLWSGKHKTKFWKVESGRERKELRQESE